MGEAYEVFQIGPLRDWPEARTELDKYLLRLGSRLDQQEGRSGTPRFYNAIDMQGFAIHNGPSPQINIPDTDFITKGYADGRYIKIDTQISGGGGGNTGGGGGVVGTGEGTPNRIAKFITGDTIGDSGAWSVPSTTPEYQNVEIGTSAPVSTDSTPLYVKRAQNASTDIYVINDGLEYEARACFVAASDTGNMYVGATSSIYGLWPIMPDQGFLATVGMSNGMAFFTDAGKFRFTPAGSLITGVEITDSNSTFKVERTFDGDSFATIENLDPGFEARAYFTASSDGGRIHMGATSQLYGAPDGSPLQNDQGFVATEGLTNGMAFWTSDGTFRFTPASSLITGVEISDANSVLKAERTFDGDSFITIENLNEGLEARAYYVASSDGGRLHMGVSSALYGAPDGSPIRNDSAFIATESLTHGLMIYTDIGWIRMVPGGNLLAAVTVEDTNAILIAERPSPTDTEMKLVNIDTGALSRAYYTAKSDAGEIHMGSTSAVYGGVGTPLLADQGFLSTENLSNGLAIYTLQGTIRMTPAASAVTAVTVSDANNVLKAERRFDGDTFMNVENLNTGLDARAYYLATVDGGSLDMGATSSIYGGSYIQNDQGFIATEGLSNGLLIYTSAGYIRMQPAGSIVTAVTVTDANSVLKAERFFNGDTFVTVENVSSGGFLARAYFVASVNGGRLITGATSSTYGSSPLQADQGFIVSEGLSNGLAIFSDAGFIRLTPAASTIAAVTVTDANTVFKAERLANADSIATIENMSSGVLARAYFMASVNGGQLNMGGTSTTYSPGGVQPLLADQAFIATDNLSNGLAIYTSAGSIRIIPGGNLLTAFTVADSNSLVVAERPSATDTIMRLTNSTVGALSRAYYQATSNGAVLNMGVTSSIYSGTPLMADQGFIATENASNGLMLWTDAGNITMAVGGSTGNFALLADGALFLLDSAAAPGAGKLRFNGATSKWQMDNGAGYVDIGSGTGGGVVGASGTINYIPKFDTATTIADSMIVDDGTSIIIGDTTTLTADNHMELTRSRTLGELSLVRNSNTGVTAFAGMVVRSGVGSSTNDSTFGVTSSGFTPTAGLGALQGFIRTGFAATGGLVIQTGAGAINFQPAALATLVSISDTANLIAAQKNTNSDIIIKVANSDTGSSARAYFSAVSNGSSLNFGTTSTGYSGTPLLADQGFVSTVGASNGFIIWTDAGDITMAVGGSLGDFTLKADGALLLAPSTAATGAGKIRYYSVTSTWQIDNGAGYADLGTTSGGIVGTANYHAKFATSSTLTNSLIYDDGTSLIVGATSTATADNHVEVTRNQIGGELLLVRNSNTGGSLSFAGVVVRSGTGLAQNDATLGVTGPVFATTGGITAATGFLRTGTTATGGLVIQTGANAIQFQPAGTTTLVTIADAPNLIVAQKNANSDSIIKVANASGAVNSRAYFTAATDACIINFGTTSTGYSGAPLLPDQAFISTQGAANGLLVWTDAGDITMAVGGSTGDFTLKADGALQLLASTAAAGVGRIRFYSATSTWQIDNGTGYINILGNSQLSDVLSITPGSTFRNIQIGTTTPESSDSQPLYVRRDQNGSTDIVSLNNTSAGDSRSSFRAIAGGGVDVYFGATSVSYTPSGGLASRTGFVYSGGAATNGMLLKAAAGPINFQVAGNLLNTVSMNGSGYLLNAFENVNSDTVVSVANSSSGVFARSTFVAFSDSGDFSVGITSSGYGGGSPHVADQGFFVSHGASNGMLIWTDAGPILLHPANGPATVTLTNSTQVLAVQKNTNSDTIVKVANATFGNIARAYFTSASDGCVLNMGTTSSNYFGAPLLADQAFIATQGASNGMLFWTDVGDITLAVGGSTGDFILKADGALQLASSSAAAGAGKMRFSSGQWQMDNGSGYAPIETGLAAVADARLSSNIPRLNVTNSFNGDQIINSGNLNFTYGRGVAAAGTSVALAFGEVQFYHNYALVGMIGQAGTRINISGDMKTLHVDGAGYVYVTP